MNVDAFYIRSSLWPAILFTIILMVVGGLGNALIIFIYRHHFYRSVPWLFIYVLAILDFLTCLISMPTELLILSTFTSFPSDAWCKISRYLSFTLHGSSCVILMAIALNRYEKVCRPNNQKLNLRRAKIFCIGTIIFACLSFIPSFFLYGKQPVPMQIVDGEPIFVPITNMSVLFATNSTSRPIFFAQLCIRINSSSMSVLATVFFLFQFILYLALVILIIFFYSKVIRKMVSYSNKQQILLLQMDSRNKRVDHIRKASSDNRSGVPDNEPTGDFSQDFYHNEISANVNRCQENEQNQDDEKNNLGSKKFDQDYLKVEISPPIHGSENNIGYTSTKETGDPLETNQLLMRRIQSTDNFANTSVRIPRLQLVPSIDPYEALFEPLFLHAPKTQKKKSTIKNKKEKSNLVSRSKSNVDVSMRMIKTSNCDGNERIVSCRSLEGLSTIRCNNMVADGTLTITKRTPKGSKNCVIPLTGMSVKSAVGYDTLNKNQKDPDQKDKAHSSQGKLEDDNNDNLDDKSMEEQLDKTNDRTLKDEENPKTTSIRFNVQETEQKPAQLRIHRDSSSGIRSNTSDKILTPTPAPRRVDYQRRQSVRPIRAQRTSRMLFWISLAFVLSFLPFWIIVFVRMTIGPGFMMTMSYFELGLINVIIRFTLISNAINPLIYGFMNTQFRNRCSNLFRWSAKSNGMAY